MADVDLSGYSPWTPIGTSSVDYFSGNFNGNGHSITGLFINTTSDYQGLFGYVSGSSKLKSITILNCSVTGGQYTAGLAGYFIQDGSGNATISDCFVSGNITGKIMTGGLVGWICPNTAVPVPSKVLRCRVDANVGVISPTTVLYLHWRFGRTIRVIMDSIILLFDRRYYQYE